MRELLPDFIRGIVSTIMNVVLLLSLLQPKYSRKVTHLAMLGILTVNLGSTFYGYLSGNLTMLAKFDVVLFAVLCFAVKPLFKDTFMQWLFSYITIMNVDLLIIVLSFIASRHLPYPLYTNSVIRLVLFLLFYWLLLIHVRPLYRQVVEHWNVFFYVALSVNIAYICLLAFTDDIVESLIKQTVPLLLVSIIAVTAYISVFHSLSTLSREHTLREEKLRSDARQELLQSDLASQEAFINLTRQSRHDMRHHNALLVDYLERGDIEGAKQYLLQHDAHITEVTLKQYCKNPVANAVLRRYARRAENGGISFRSEANIPEVLPFTAPETGELFSNLLENACEACEKVKNKAFITLTVQTDSDSLQLELRNSVAVRIIFSEKGLPLTTKAGGGAGTRSTANVVKKYGGMLCFSQEGDVFITRIILHMNKGEALSAANCNL
jgi:signal transduction histidine kinase